MKPKPGDVREVRSQGERNNMSNEKNWKSVDNIKENVAQGCYKEGKQENCMSRSRTLKEKK